MSWLDWVVVALYFAVVITIGVTKGRRAHELEDYFLAKRSMRWWAVGLSVMATQASAITLIGGTGQSCVDGMGFLQIYLGLPFAMVILCRTIVPFFHRARVYTAYEYLERRFGPKTRLLTSAMFLLSRALSDSVIMYVPSVVLSTLLGFDERIMIVLTGATCITYTVLGGMRAVMWTEVFQMIMVFVGVLGCLVSVVLALPHDVPLRGAIEVAGAAHKLEIVSFDPDPHRTYTLWSGVFGGMFLMLSYFGCDQSQVQRYLTARSVGEARLSLLFNAFAKLPMQFLILSTGALIYVFFVFHEPPVSFDRTALERARASGRGERLAMEESRFRAAHAERAEAARRLLEQPGPEQVSAFRDAEARVVESKRAADQLIDPSFPESQVGLGKEKPRTDTNYIFPAFVIGYLPAGLLGLLLVAIFAAAMSAVESELNSLSTASIVDFYQRFRPARSERHYVVASKVSTVLWGSFSTLMATTYGHLGSAIETVNRIGSYFYGPILGVFVLALGLKLVKDGAAAIGIGIGVAAVWACRVADISFLYFNLAGCVATVAAGVAITLATGKRAIGGEL